MEPDELAVVAGGKQRCKNSPSSTSPVPCPKMCIHHPLSLSRKMTWLPNSSSRIGMAAESSCTAAPRRWRGRRRKMLLLFDAQKEEHGQQAEHRIHLKPWCIWTSWRFVNGCWSICKNKHESRDKLLPLQR